jgi:xanthine dehydrogenase accessory factor
VKGILGAAAAARAVGATYAGGDPVAVVTVVAGPGAGRRLLVHAASISGTLGTPALDAAARDLGRRALAAGGTLLEEIDLAAVAGATPAGVGAHPAPARATLFAETHHPPEELVIVGAGHIAVPLAELGVRLGYRVVVLDDREEFATAERFPAAARVLRTDFADPFREVRIDARSHLVLVTRAHRYDYDCLLRLLEGDAAPSYIGMIGSRRRVRATFLALLEAGVPRERIAVVRAPVGLEIGAETPAEIAVSVAAELIMLRRGVLDAAPIAERERVLERLLPEAGRAATERATKHAATEGSHG